MHKLSEYFAVFSLGAISCFGLMGIIYGDGPQTITTGVGFLACGLVGFATFLLFNSD